MHSRRLTHVSNAVGQVVRNLTHIPVFVLCNQERKHCPAHSLAGWSNGSRQRAGQSWSQCQRTISGEHMHTKREHRRDPPVWLNDTVSRSPRHWGNYAEKLASFQLGLWFSWILLSLCSLLIWCHIKVKGRIPFSLFSSHPEKAPWDIVFCPYWLF